jgi:hypothetical protein
MIRLFIDCQMFDWNHLPRAGGVWDQDPEVMDAFRLINYEINKVERENQRKEAANKKGGWDKQR